MCKYLVLEELGPIELWDDAFQDSQLELFKAKFLRENNSVSYRHMSHIHIHILTRTGRYRIKIFIPAVG
jgi:hypothetical protein